MRNTSELQFTLRLNTPAFVGGAQQGTRRVDFKKKGREGVWEDRHEDVPFFPAEPGGIRVPSLRGVLAFWYRSTLGRLDPAEVFDRQGKVLGSIVRGQGVTIRPCGSEFQSDELRYSGRDVIFERLYLGYGPLQLLKIADTNDRNGMRDLATSFNGNACREAILVPAVRPTFRFAAHGTPEQIRGLRRALELLHTFGSIGARCRRGWGSVEVEAEGIPSIPAHRVLASHLHGVLAELLSSDSQERPRFTAFSRQTRVFLTPAADTAEAVLGEFARTLLRERSYYQRQPRAEADHALEVQDFGRLPEEAITEIPTRLAFGLPFTPKHERRWEIEYRGRIPGGDSLDPRDDVSRRSSPLLLKVIRTGDGKYVGVALFLKAQFFGDPRREVGAKGKQLTVPFGEEEYRVIDEFLEQSGWAEVRI